MLKAPRNLLLLALSAGLPSTEPRSRLHVTSQLTLAGTTLPLEPPWRHKDFTMVYRWLLSAWPRLTSLGSCVCHASHVTLFCWVWLPGQMLRRTQLP